ncbi:MAG: DUF2207 domain-containing protein [Dehalococcoidia bacterium]|nr:DUF2207 domain-containing protein [Dehalococcoidia bacterium]
MKTLVAPRVTVPTAFALLLLAVALLPLHASAAESMPAFEAHYQVNADGTVDVTETITWDFESAPDRHGIFRDLALTGLCGAPGARLVDCESGYNRRWDYDTISVTGPAGEELPFETDEVASNSPLPNQELLRIRIGDPDATVTGVQTYVLRYRIHGALDATPGADELYWNVTGAWTVPIQAATVTVTAPSGATIEPACYQGPLGTTTKCAAAAAGNTATYTANGPIRPTQQMTVSARFDAGTLPLTAPRLSPLAAAQVAESMRSFEADYTINEDGTVDVVEVIEWDFASARDRHGIFRDLIATQDCPSGAEERVYPCPTTHERSWEYSDISVEDERGRDVPFEQSREEDAVRLKIGDADIEVTGVQTYVIRYRIEGVLDAYEDFDQLFWNASGTWPVPVERFVVRVTLPSGEFDRTFCYEGDPDDDVDCPSRANGAVASFTSDGVIPPGEQVTIAAEFPKGIAEIQPPMLKDKPTIDDYFALDPLELGGAVLGSLAGVAGVVALWWRQGRDRAYKSLYYLTNDPTEGRRPLFAKQDIVVEYLPPDGLRPAQMGMILDEKADTLDVTATMVDLAVRGHLHITEIPKKGWFGSKDWKLEKLQGEDQLLPYESKLLSSLFQSGDTVEISDLKDKFATRLGKVKEELVDDAMKRKWFSQKPGTSKGIWVGAAIALVAIGGLVGFGAAVWIGRALLGAPFVVAGIILFFMSFSMARRTATGSEALRRVLGFRLYVATAEKRMQEFNEQQNIFARYLPYAMIFDVVDKWAKAFEGLENDPAQAGTASWYTGIGAFSAASFASDMSGFSSSVSSTIASTPSSSGSGSSGGAGGGGGGGGGGSW